MGGETTPSKNIKSKFSFTEQISDDTKLFLKEATDHHLLLKDFKNIIAKELKQEVYDHYQLFLVFSKQVSKVETELIELGKLWNDMKSIINSASELKLSQQFAKDLEIGQQFDNSTINDQKQKINLIEDMNDILAELSDFIALRDWKNAIVKYKDGKNFLTKNHQIMPDEKLKEFDSLIIEFSEQLFKELKNVRTSFKKTQDVVHFLSELGLKEQVFFFL